MIDVDTPASGGPQHGSRLDRRGPRAWWTRADPARHRRPPEVDRTARRPPDTTDSDGPGRPASAFPSTPPTAEVEWARLVARAPELPLSARPVIVVAPHPDDESLAIGGLLTELRTRDVEVEVLAVTDGEASHPDLCNLGAVRSAEQSRALAALGLDAPPVRLGLPDGQIGQHTEVLAQALEERSGPESVILAPWARDGHPDHDASGTVAIDVARRTGAALWAYPVWAWRWADLDDLAALALRRVTLGADARAAKARAIACHQSQTTHLDGPPILSEDVLAHFHRPWDAIIDGRSLLDA